MQKLNAQDIAALEQDIARAIQAGRHDEAGVLWLRILDGDPDNRKALTALSQRSFRAGDLLAAKALLQRLIAADGGDQQEWINLAVVCQGLRDEEGEAAAIRGALSIDPNDMLALLLRGNLLERQGKTHEAARAYGAAATVAPPMEQVNPDLRPMLRQALQYRDRYNSEFGTFMDRHLSAFFKDMRGEDLGRFRESVDIMFGRKQRYESRPALFHFSGLAPITFFDRGLFPWIEQVEASTDAIRDEFLAVLKADQGFTPYLTYPADLPHNQFAQLNNSPDWSAYHLIEKGARVEAHAAQCPATMAALALAPQPRQSKRTPTAMFSLLKPKTRIPAHTGVSNVRLVTHLPLILPPDCGFRVGNDVRAWEMGKAWVFDDTIEHEAWNDSDQLRVLLIFDVWHPQLSAAERAAITAMSEGIEAFGGMSGGFEL
ncbi:aspartyl/asparaginyl beta-hydroxylase domain-containing protein [Pseudoduganella namucuonensis]|uniref:Aspartyl/asparaginyl beta-hydroxylase, cupin superfamily n=1 Tax=Pseudoduganella namucuonensis TaxID=1035707 RepID=A0A1I7LLW0_9BURK|nr:aspartyl/asparaginyl beta-hydroxylase domain-containing protein [Pseudoduganella namucuonensis]SFV10706.1 Aspartyl/asparaginyl beta-hydroxylase, cupin superfamily [Pseudoduganella namucuonensis]